jgi:hypothetical protein
MFGIILLVCILAALGFVLAWISNVVAHEDMEVKTGVIILILAGILGWGAQHFLAEMGEAAAIIGGTAAQFAALVLMINLLGKIDFKKSAIIAAVFTAILWVVGFVLGMMFAS